MLKLVIQMYVYLNLNPKNMKVGDCVVRAIAAATGQTWEKVYTELTVEGFELADMPNANSVWDSYLRKIGFKRYIIPDSCPFCYTIGQFADEHQHGTYIVATGTHVVCVKDGDLLDNWDSSDITATYYYSKE